MKVAPPQPPDLRNDNWALFLDIDGTLLEHAAHPDDVVVGAELRDLLVALNDCLGGALAFVTGRSVAAVDHLFAPLRLRAAGLYGLEHRLEPEGPVTAADEPADIAALARELEAEFAGQNVYIERKGPILAVHTRAAPHLLARSIELVEQALDSLPDGYRALPGNAGVELMPLEAAKGAAIRRFMAMSPFRGRRPVFLGDDTSDENGFEAINEAGGLSVRVRPDGATIAQYSVANVADAFAWLSRFEHVNRS
ncbi:trehalose-phosphatase [Mesorhizobium sp. SP-1A]|uniref:trehalose-phosphatase n=1 Tax=Mesorhizobium sp. SP-1A TaxID=3077840 RepID=UPI0028F6FB10|nr:trehalose-phosphatase [Mesorhizobium sp. SP-1A]